MNRLLPCPFCGGEAHVIPQMDGISGTVKYSVYCGSRCGVVAFYCDTEAEAVAAWNTRADDYRQAAEYWQRMYEQSFTERTCRDTGENEWHFVCSACGYEQNGYECWNYCPSCGARVVS